MSDQIILDLVRKAQQGDKESLSVLFDQFLPFRISLARQFAGKGVDRDEIKQQVDLFFIEAILGYDESKDPSPVRHITLKTRADIWGYYRREYRNEMRNVSWTNQEAESPINFDDIINRIDVQDALLKLSKMQRTVVLMYFYDGMNQYMIAQELGINQSNVSRLLHRSINRLRKILENGE